MGKEYTSLLKNKWITFLLIPFMLIGIWIGLSLIYINNSSGLTVLTHVYNQSVFSNATYHELLANKKLTGSFIAAYDNLGIVSVRFNTYDQINNDVVIFKIKEHVQNSWYYQNTYKTDQFQPNQFFTFGLPPIVGSSGKKYDFEIVSTKGKRGNAVALSPIVPQVSTKYQYDKRELVSSRSLLTVFLVKKLQNSFSNLEFLFSSFVYLIPLGIYLFYMLLLKKFLKKKYYTIFIPIVLFCMESLIYIDTNFQVIVILLSLYVLIVLSFRLSMSITFLFVCLFLLLSAFSLGINNTQIADHFAMWAYLLIWVGTLQIFRENISRNKKVIEYKEFIANLGVKR